MHRRGSPGSDPQAPSQGAFSHAVPPCLARPRHWSQREGRQPPCPGESGPTRAQANIWLGGGKEPKEAPVGSYLSSPSSPQEGALPRVGLVVSFYRPSQIAQGMGLGPQKVQSPAKGLPASPSVHLSHSITTLRHRHCLFPGECCPEPGPSQQATPCPGQGLAQSPSVRGGGGLRHARSQESQSQTAALAVESLAGQAALSGMSSPQP